MPPELTAAVERMLADAGKIDVLVNNAGSPPTLSHVDAGGDWDRVIDTNLNGAYRWCKAVIRPMFGARRGVIINIASIAALSA